MTHSNTSPLSRNVSNRRQRLSISGCALLVTAALAGCSLSPSANTVVASNSGAAIFGNVHGGEQPVANSTVSLFATSTSGYNTAPTLLASAITDSSGNWSVTPGYTCPAGAQVYATASGGNPGLSGSVDNSAIFLLAALGPCTNFSNAAQQAATTVVINEATTVAAAYALAGFAPAGGGGLIENAITAGFATSATNLQGLSDAFANAANIVSSTTGTAYTVPLSTASGTAPQSTVYTLANILQACVNTSGPSSSTCQSLFAAATPPTGSGIAAPVNVLQAVLDIAQYPGNNVGALWALVTPNGPFIPALSAMPSDWTVSVVYTGGQLASAQGMTIDDTDNVWISGSTYASLAEFSPQGAALSPVGATATTQAGWIPSVVTVSHTIRNLSFDQSGDLWLPDSSASQVYKYVPGGTATSPTVGTLTPISLTTANANLGAVYDLGIDAAGNVWLDTYKKNACANAAGALCAFVELPVSASYAPVSTFSGNTYTVTQSSKTMAVDPNTGNVWVAPNNASNVQIFQSPYSSAPLNVTLAATTANPQGMAIDGSGNAWIVGFTGGKLFQVGPTGTLLNTITNTTELQEANFITIDGNGNLFLPNYLSSTVAEYSPSFNSGAGTFLSPSTGFNPRATYNSAASKYTGGVVSSPVEAGVDRSGALWILNQGTGSVVQVLGVAAPTRPVLAYGQYSLKP